MSEERLGQLIETHVGRYPESEIMDVYKLLHQATFGVGHLIANKKSSREVIETRMGQINPDPDAPLVESIHPDGAIVRLHLRPYMALGGDAKALVNALVDAAAAVEGDPAEMAARWEAFAAMCAPGGALADRFTRREVTLVGRIRHEEHWPAVHHSPIYINAYRPDYRVLTHTAAEKLVQKFGGAFEVI